MQHFAKSRRILIFLFTLIDQVLANTDTVIIIDLRHAHHILKESRDDWTRTSDLFVPNEARYQLRYIPIFETQN